VCGLFLWNDTQHANNVFVFFDHDLSLSAETWSDASRYCCGTEDLLLSPGVVTDGSYIYEVRLIVCVRVCVCAIAAVHTDDDVRKRHDMNTHQKKYFFVVLRATYSYPTLPELKPTIAIQIFLFFSCLFGLGVPRIIIKKSSW
jgi:hypothetical protein